MQSLCKTLMDSRAMWLSTLGLMQYVLLQMLHMHMHWRLWKKPVRAKVATLGASTKKANNWNHSKSRTGEEIQVHKICFIQSAGADHHMKHLRRRHVHFKTTVSDISSSSSCLMARSLGDSDYLASDDVESIPVMQAEQLNDTNQSERGFSIGRTLITNHLDSPG